MTDVLRFPNRRRARAEACEWLSRLDRGLSEEESAALDAWLAADPAHPLVLIEIAALWDETGVLGELSDLFPLENYRRGIPRRRLPIAAAIAALVVGLGWTLIIENDVLVRDVAVEQTVSSLHQSFETAVGEQSTVTLDNGTRVSLNTDTSVDVRLSAEERLVVLRRGEGWFDVMHDANRPFEVHAGNRIVQAIGTSFNVQLGFGGELEVTVTEGRVRVLARPGDEPPFETPQAAPQLENFPGSVGTVVVAGQSAIFGEVSEVRQLEPEEIEARLAWQQAMLIFRGETLEEVVREVSRYTNTEFRFATEVIRDIRVGGYFQTGDVDGLLAALRNNFQIESERVEEDLVVLSAQ